jgi:DNA-binding MarR family transcriptional regulator
LVILNQFIMKSFSNASQLASDGKGRLYDRGTRDYLDSLFGIEKARRMEAFAAIRWLVAEMRQHKSRLAELQGLSEGRFELLLRLKHGSDAPLGELAEQLHVSPRNVTGLVDHLERDGLVERRPDPNDRRSVRAHLTEKGTFLIERAWRQATESSLALTNGFSQEQLDQVRHTCLQLVIAIHEAAGGDHSQDQAQTQGEGMQAKTGGRDSDNRDHDQT